MCICKAYQSCPGTSTAGLSQVITRSTSLVPVAVQVTAWTACEGERLGSAGVLGGRWTQVKRHSQSEIRQNRSIREVAKLNNVFLLLGGLPGPGVTSPVRKTPGGRVIVKPLPVELTPPGVEDLRSTTEPMTVKQKC